MYGWENAYSGLMSPWGGAWGMQPVAESLIREQIAPLDSAPTDANGGNGYSAPTNQSTGPQTANDARRSREVMGQLGGYAAGRLGNTAMDALGATAAGFSPSISDVVGAGVRGLMDPTGLASLGGRVAAQQMGFTGFAPGLAEKAVGVVSPTVGGLLTGLNPLAGLAYGALSPFAIDALADGLDARKDEGYKDAFESAHGNFGGRSVAKDVADMMSAAGFGSMAHGYGNQGYGPKDAARGMTNKDASSVARGGNPMGNTYGATRGVGFTNSIGGPLGGARSVSQSYGPGMGGFAGLGIGNPSSYGGGRGGSNSDRGGFGDNDGNSDTAGNAGYGR